MKVLYDVIRFEPSGSNWLVYKHAADQFNNKSKLIVSTGQVALLVHNGKLEKIVENGTFTLNSEFYPIVKTFTNYVHGGKNAYPIEVYFINKIIKLDFLWGTSEPIDLIDPKFGISLRIRARGQFGIKLDNYQFFFQNFIGTTMKGQAVTYETLSNFLRGISNQKIKDRLSTYIINNQVTYFEINKHLEELASQIKTDLTDEVKSIGFDIKKLSIESINVPQDNLEALNKILAKKAEYETLGDETYRITKGYDVLQGAAENNSATGMFMGAGFGMGANANPTSIIPEKKEKTVTSSIKCPKCNTSLNENAKFCGNCGLKLKVTCKCGAIISGASKFCPECGAKVGESNE